MNEQKDRVLVVHDEPQILRALEDLLSEDFSVLKSNSGAQALALAEREGDIAVVVSDEHMPNMTGGELLSRVYQCCGATGILLTGFADTATAARTPAFAVATKPWNPDDLRLKVQRAAEHFRMRTELERERRMRRDRVELAPEVEPFKDQLARLTRVYAVTSRINAAIARIDDARALLEESSRVAVEMGRFTAAGVAELDPRLGTICLTTRWPPDSPALELIAPSLNAYAEAGGALTQVLRTQQHVVVNDLTEGPESALRTELLKIGLRSAALFPLVVNGSTSHIFALLSDRASPFDLEEVKLFTELADNLSYALTQIGKTQKLKFLAYHDELTGLPNRALLLDRLDQQIATAERNHGQMAVLVLDIARLRQINETLGRRSGDALLLQVARRLTEALPKQATLARVEGSAFAVLLPEMTAEAEGAVLVENCILQTAREPFVIAETELRISFRVGIALFPTDAKAGDALFAKAENALKNAKVRAQSYLFYAPTMNERVAEKLALETKLRRAIEREEFVLHYQPKVELKDGEIVGLEALIRWRDPERGLIPPGRFIPILEETGMILEVGRWALRRASRQYGEWLAAGLEPPRIAVNVSAVQLAAPDFLQSLFAVLDESAHPSGIDLEITESVFVENLVDSVEKLQAARNRGLRVAIDDFGTGYSSLGYLTRLPIDFLKIDRSFIVGMADDPQEMAIVMMIISLARSMDLRVVAEGVETQPQARLLRLIKCNELQGYLFAKPVPAEEIPALLPTKLKLSHSTAPAAR